MGMWEWRMGRPDGQIGWIYLDMIGHVVEKAPYDGFHTEIPYMRASCLSSESQLPIGVEIRTSTIHAWG